jgi:ferredoxin-NADP reductase
LAGQLKPGDRVWVRGPMGRFFLKPNEDRPAVLLSTGIGVTPVLSMALAIAGSRPGREVHWFHGVRNEAEFALSREVRSLPGSMPGLRLHIRHSRPASDPASFGESRGRVDFEFVRQKLPHLDFDYYLCGNRVFMEQMYAGLRAAGVAADRIHYEFFSQGDALERPTPGGAAAAPVRVTFVRSGRELIWEPDAPSLLDFAERNGVPMEFGCRYGNCHACKVTLVDGKVRHFPLADPPPDPRTILTCSSVPESDVAIDA